MKIWVTYLSLYGSWKVSTRRLQTSEHVVQLHLHSAAAKIFWKSEKRPSSSCWWRQKIWRYLSPSSCFLDGLLLCLDLFWLAVNTPLTWTRWNWTNMHCRDVKRKIGDVSGDILARQLHQHHGHECYLGGRHLPFAQIESEPTFSKKKKTLN